VVQLLGKMMMMMLEYWNAGEDAESMLRSEAEGGVVAS
jgi:hypothetical protein